MKEEDYQGLIERCPDETDLNEPARYVELCLESGRTKKRTPQRHFWGRMDRRESSFRKEKRQFLGEVCYGEERRLRQ